MKDLCEFGEAIKGWLSCNALYNCFQEYVDDGKIIEGQQVILLFFLFYFFLFVGGREMLIGFLITFSFLKSTLSVYVQTNRNVNLK